MIFRLGGILIAAFAFSFTPSQQPSQNQTPTSDTFSMTGPQFWRTPFGESPWIPLAGDADGDGHADLIAVGPEGESRVEIARTSALGKPFGSNIARKSLGSRPLANACDLFKAL